MTSDIKLPKGEIRGTGTLIYRCAKCGELIHDLVVAWTDGDPEHVKPETRTWHMEHAPEDSHGG